METTLPLSVSLGQSVLYAYLPFQALPVANHTGSPRGPPDDVPGRQRSPTRRSTVRHCEPAVRPVRRDVGGDAAAGASRASWVFPTGSGAAEVVASDCEIMN